MNSWFDILTFEPHIKYHEKSVRASTERITEVMKEEAKHLNGDYSKIFLGGFSQGAFMAIDAALLAPF